MRIQEDLELWGNRTGEGRKTLLGGFSSAISTGHSSLSAFYVVSVAAGSPEDTDQRRP